jgi:4-hydroxy-tetrahydrodipicolinate reductase
MTRLRVVSYGLGPIGCAAARLVLGKRELDLVGAIDTDPAKLGRDVGELLGIAEPTGIQVEGDAAAALARLRPDAILHCTSSFLPVVKDQLVQAARAGVDIVSSSEELLLPDLQHPELAAEIDAAARQGGATVLGTGVNPGFAMDFMAVVASAVCTSVESARCVRIVDAGTRRLPLQRKVGAGLTRAAFAEQEKTGRFGHIGMRESVALVGRGLGFALDSITQTLEPVFAEDTRTTPFLTVEKGQVAGIHNIGIGRRGDDVLVTLDLSMYVGAPQPRDEVILVGTPNVHLRFQGGIPGDAATAAILVNSLPQVVAAGPGLKTVLDLPPPRLVR